MTSQALMITDRSEHARQRLIGELEILLELARHAPAAIEGSVVQRTFMAKPERDWYRLFIQADVSAVSFDTLASLWTLPARSTVATDRPLSDGQGDSR